MKLGDSWEVDEDLLRKLEVLTCSFYGKYQKKSLNHLRVLLLSKRCNTDGKLDAKRTVDLASLPPCFSTHVQHVKRCNLQVGIWKRALENFPEIPDADKNGWVFVDDVLEPCWTEEEVLPTDLSVLIECAEESESEDVEEDDSSDDSEVSLDDV